MNHQPVDICSELNLTVLDASLQAKLNTCLLPKSKDAAKSLCSPSVVWQHPQQVTKSGQITSHFAPWLQKTYSGRYKSVRDLSQVNIATDAESRVLHHSKIN